MSILGTQAYTLVARGAAAAGVTRALLRRSSRYPVILMYHGIRTPEQGVGLGNYRQKNVEREAFVDQMTYLAHHHDVISLDRLIQCMSAGEPLPERAVVVTFDDGYASTYQWAFPVCRALGVPFTVFVVSSFVDGGGPLLWMDWLECAIANTSCTTVEHEADGECSRWSLTTRRERELADSRIRARLKRLTGLALQRELAALARSLNSGPTGAEQVALAPCTWPMLREMANSGIVSIGAHMVEHESVAYMDRNAAQHGLVACKLRIEQQLEGECRHFAFPFGQRSDMGDSGPQFVRAAGYASAVSSLEGIRGCGKDAFALRRTGINGHYDDPAFRGAVAGLHAYCVAAVR